MATSFPGAIQTFTQMIDLSSTDGNLVEQYQVARNNNDIALANQILSEITNADQKLLTADKINILNETCVALQDYYTARYSSAYVVSASQPSAQENGDFWFRVVG